LPLQSDHLKTALEEPRSSTARTDVSWLLIALIVIAAVKFVLRGPERAVWNSGDFMPIYLAARAWMHGLDPCAQLSPAGLRALYPPPTFVVVAPLALMPWPFAKAVWCVLNLAALALLIGFLHRLAEIRFFGPRSLCLIAGTLALEPSSTAIMLGQPCIIVASLVAYSILAAERGSQSLSGVTKGLGLALKPQLAAAFALPHLIGRRWKICIAIGLTVLVLGGIALLQLHSQPGWFANYLSNLKSAFGPGGGDDPGPTNPNRVQLINLRYPLTVLLGNGLLAAYVPLLTGALLAIPPLLALIQRPTGLRLIHCVSLLALVELIVIYHRSYDAILVVFPMAWALSAAVPRNLAWPVLLTVAMFFLPSGVGVQALGEQDWFPIWISSGLLWRGLFIPYQAWALVVMACWMLYCLVSQTALPRTTISRNGGIQS